MQHDRAFPGCSGELAAHIRAHDWSGTGFGPLREWPSHLYATVALMLANPVPMALLWGPDGLLLYNDAYARLCGEQHPGILGRPVTQAWPGAAAFNRHVMHEVLQGRDLSYHDHPISISRNGRTEQHWFNLHFGPVRDPAGRPDGVLAVVMETTPRVQAEEQLHQSQKLEAIGKLTGGVAHDFNNVLQVINGNLHLLRMQAQGNERMEKRLQSASAAVAKGARLAAQLLAFARRQPLEPEPLDVGRLLLSMDEMLRRLLGEGVRVRTTIAPDLWTALVDSHQLESAILNLAINARDAIDSDGELVIEAANASLRDHFVPGMPAGDYIALTVSDDGCGMPAEVAAHAFEPFFTTKPAGQGTGLGLSMVHGFVHQSGGYLHLDTAPQAGTRITIYLPRHAARRVAHAQRPAGGADGGNERILVVEDDEQVRETATDMLTQMGYRVREACDPDAALEILHGGGRFDLIFTDVVMPGRLKSPELVSKARELLPEIKVLYTSGYTADAITRQGRLEPGVVLLPKPYGREDLARKLRQVLDGGRSPSGPGK